jgi:hypothetical protein
LEYNFSFAAWLFPLTESHRGNFDSTILPGKNFQKLFLNE